MYTNENSCVKRHFSINVARHGPPIRAASGCLGPPQAASGRLRAIIRYREGGYKMDACWSIVIISNLPFSLTKSRGEYLRVVGILEMVK